MSWIYSLYNFSHSEKPDYLPLVFLLWNYIRDFIEFTWFSNFFLASWWGESMKVLSTNLNHIVGFSVVILKAISSICFILSLVWEQWAYIQAFFLRMYIRTQLELCCLCSECYLHKVIYQNNGIFSKNVYRKPQIEPHFWKLWWTGSHHPVRMNECFFVLQNGDLPVRRLTKFTRDLFNSWHVKPLQLTIDLSGELFL